MARAAKGDRASGGCGLIQPGLSQKMFGTTLTSVSAHSKTAVA